MPDMTLAGFIGFIGGAAARMEHGTHTALEHAARIVEREAKAEVGTYQDAAGPFAAWAPLAEATQADRVAKGFSPNDPLLRTGALRDSIGHKVEGHEAVVGSPLDIAVYQELGTNGGGWGGPIPPRSFLGGAAVRKAPEVAHVIGHGLVQALVGPGVKVRIEG